MKAVYAGSFDPITNGHVWMIERAASMFAELVVAVGVNPEKKSTFSVEERVGMIREVTGHIANVNVETFTNKYLARYASEVGARFIIRGIRNEQDYGYERGMRYVNEEIDGALTTVFLIPPRRLVEASSSLVKGLVGPEGWHGVVRGYVPLVVYEAMARRAGEYDMTGLRKMWDEMIERLGLNPARAGKHFDELVRSYSGADRKYHDLFHVQSVVEKCREMAEEAGWDEQWSELDAALWFHDVVYDAKRSDNEAESARVAAAAFKELGLPAERIERIARMIRATRHNGTAETEMERTACDIDLLSLATPEATFRRNTGLIREEYKHLNDEEFRRGRAAFLEKMLGKGRTFYSEAFEEEYGLAASRNLRSAVERLRGSGEW